jgi:hypothetical protein
MTARWRAFFVDNEEIKVIYSKIFKNISLWASQSFARSVLIILILVIFGIPFIEYLQGLVKNFPYTSTGLFISSFLQKTFNVELYIIGGAFIIVGIVLYWMYRQLTYTKIINDNFKGGLNAWAIPLGASWTTQRCEDKLGKMLTVTNSTIPATLKGAYWWYDYEITFEAKIEGESPPHRQNFTIVIRSENNFNGIMLQITKTHMRPHFIYQGTFIIDNEASQLLPTTLRENEWIKVKMTVKGNIVDIYINDYQLRYNIPTKIFSVENNIMSKGTITLEEIQTSDSDIKSKQRRIGEILSMPPSAARDQAVQTIESIANTIPPYSNIILEYQKGSVGFRESGEEKAHFREFKAKRI